VKILRQYQEAATSALFQFIFSGKKENPLVVVPVAGGKSLLIAEFIKRVHAIYPRTRIVMLTHVKELLEQSAKELYEQYKECDMGFYCAGLNQKRLHNDVTFASIQSIHNKIAGFNRVPEIIIIDECHLISHKNDTRYRKFIDDVLALNPNCKIIGYTGTPFRADTGRLDAGDNRLFDEIAYEVSMDYMIEQGYWAKPVCPEVATKMDITGVSVVGGDYVASQLEAAINKPEITDACVAELLDKGENRRKWLVFTAGIQHAHDVAEEIENCGISVSVITSKTPKAERKKTIKDFRAGRIRCLVNVAVLTTGFDVPDIDLLSFMRPTRSPVLYVQTVGRGVRPVYAPGYDLNTQQGRLDAIANSIKPDCMILDFGGVVATLGPIDEVSIKKEYDENEEKGDGAAIYKLCPLDEKDRNGNQGCGEICAPAQRYCFSCGYCFIRLDDEADNKAVVSRDVPAEWIEVLGMYTVPHQKLEGGPSSLKVSYATMIDTFREWVCFEHHLFDVGDNKRYAWDKAVAWHNARLPDIKVPQSALEAYELEYPTPSRILVKKDGEWWRILDYEWSREVQQQEAVVEKQMDNYFAIPF